MPFSIMPGVSVPGKKVKAEPHSTPETARTRCDGCPELSCIAQRKRTEPWRYWCELRRCRVVPREVRKRDCPLGRAAALGRPPKRR